MMWELVILYGVTVNGIGGSIVTGTESKQQCIEMIETVAVSDNGLDVVSKEGVVIVLCRLKDASS